jgi:hypothetical protein
MVSLDGLYKEMKSFDSFVRKISLGCLGSIEHNERQNKIKHFLLSKKLEVLRRFVF